MADDRAAVPNVSCEGNGTMLRDQQRLLQLGNVTYDVYITPNYLERS